MPDISAKRTDRVYANLVAWLTDNCENGDILLVCRDTTEIALYRETSERDGIAFIFPINDNKAHAKGNTGHGL